MNKTIYIASVVATNPPFGLKMFKSTGHFSQAEAIEDLLQSAHENGICADWKAVRVDVFEWSETKVVDVTKDSRPTSPQEAIDLGLAK